MLCWLFFFCVHGRLQPHPVTTTTKKRIIGSALVALIKTRRRHLRSFCCCARTLTVFILICVCDAQVEIFRSTNPLTSSFYILSMSYIPPSAFPLQGYPSAGWSRAGAAAVAMKPSDCIYVQSNNHSNCAR